MPIAARAHVRVDLIYSKLSLTRQGDLRPDRAPCSSSSSSAPWRGPAGSFAADAIRGGEVSFTEWAIQYWPVKLTIPLGAALLLLQGIARLDNQE